MKFKILPLIIAVLALIVVNCNAADETEFDVSLWKTLDGHSKIVISACFSPDKAIGIGIRIKKPWLQYPNFTVINSSSGSETSLGFDQSETGLFTYYIALGLKGKADGNNDLKVTLGELKSYVIENVMDTSNRISGLQTPQFYGDDDRVLVKW
ncbi:MAG: hypothetical protein P9X24_09540 [Candidatus Hatepunaea meridiana]|nr:hypothetical protein [Candidatus Hatepunaea meridiana]